MKKIVAEKHEGIAEIIDAILTIEDSEVVVSIPKGSILTKSASNFRLLKREADAAEKKIFVESTDDVIVTLAGDNGLESGHSFMKRASAAAGAVGISDILPKGRQRTADDDEEETSKKKKSIKLTVPGQSDSSDEDDDDGDDEEEESRKATSNFFGENRFFKPRISSADDDRNNNDNDDEPSRGSSGKTLAWVVGILIVLGIAFYAVTAIFGHAQVAIDFTQTPWSYQTNLVADQSVSTINGSAGVIPAQVFTSQKNVTQLFPATGGTQTVSTKAQGTITIYNDYSSASQELVATTRFETPSGQIFRITSDVTVPGAQVAANGMITPSSITAAIVADQGGPSYNVGPITKLTIPGFQNDAAKYAGFYGAILGTTTGGFTGVKPVPTVEDIANAKASTTAILQSDLEGGLAQSYPNNFQILDGATNIQITKLIVSTSTDSNGNFSVFGEASLTAIGFDESALENYLLTLASTNGVSSTFKTINLSYSNVQATFSKGQVSFALSAQGTVEPAFSSSDFVATIAGKSIGNARDAIQALPELSNGTISVWPIWLWNMPSNPNKIAVTVN